MYAGSVVTLTIQEANCGSFSDLISSSCCGAALQSVAALSILLGSHFPARMRLVFPSQLCFLLSLAV